MTTTTYNQQCLAERAFITPLSQEPVRPIDPGQDSWAAWLPDLEPTVSPVEKPARPWGIAASPAPIRGRQPAYNRRRRHVLLALALLVVTGMTVYAVTRVAAGVQAIASAGMPGWVWPFLAGAALVGRFAFKAGQYHRGYAHARGIRKSHWSAIRGGGKH